MSTTTKATLSTHAFCAAVKSRFSISCVCVCSSNSDQLRCCESLVVTTSAANVLAFMLLASEKCHAARTSTKTAPCVSLPLR